MNQNLFSTTYKNKTRCENEILKIDSIKSNCQNKNYNLCNRYCYVIGLTGATGPVGPSEATHNYADFCALMTADNSATVAPGTSDISGMLLVDTTTINSVLTVRNPAGNATALL